MKNRLKTMNNDEIQREKQGNMMKNRGKTMNNDKNKREKRMKND